MVRHLYFFLFIAEIKLANLKSFWTDDPATFPENSQQEIWWELWLKNRAEDENPVAIAQQLAERINATLGNTSISFFDSTVLLIKASANQLEHASELIANLEELRLAKEILGPFAPSLFGSKYCCNLL
jgi:hypothetical protein